MLVRFAVGEPVTGVIRSLGLAFAPPTPPVRESARGAERLRRPSGCAEEEEEERATVNFCCSVS